MLSTLIKWARINGHIDWDDIEDRVRAVHSGAGWINKEQFIENEMDNFLEDYRRHLVSDQDKFIECWLEKDALSSIFSRITMPYCISTVVCRGFSSVTFLHDFKERVEFWKRGGKEPVMLYFGDFDPSGLEMLEAMKTTLRDEMGVEELEFKRIALTKDDIFKYKLPYNPNALKKSDTRDSKHLAAYGKLAVELDALPPQILEQKIREAVEGEIDMQKFKTQGRIQMMDRRKLDKLKLKVEDMMDDWISQTI